MPDTEVLFYPAVEERRLVVVHGLAAAAHAVAEEDLRWTSFGKDSAAVVGGTAAQCSAVRFSRRDQILPAVAAAEAQRQAQTRRRLVERQPSPRGNVSRGAEQRQKFARPSLPSER